MKTLRNILFIAIAFLSMAMDCGKLIKGPYIGAYIEPQEIYSTAVVYYPNELYIDLSFMPDSKDFFTRNEQYIYTRDANSSKYSSLEIKHKNEKTYDSLCHVYNDLNYKTRSPIGGNTVLLNPSFDINISSTQDYDSQHAAGTILNDYFTINYVSMYEFIQNGYKNKVRDHIIENIKKESLNEFNSKENHLTSVDLEIFSAVLPETAGDYTFTITYNDVKGKTLSVTTEPVTLPARN